MPSSFYPSFFEALLLNKVGASLQNDPPEPLVDTAVVKCLLLKNDYVFSPSHNTVASISSSELTIGQDGYTRKTIPVSISLDTASQDEEGAFLNLSLTDSASWTGITFTDLKGAAIYIESPAADDATSLLVYYIEFNQLETATEDNFKILTPTTQPKIRRQ